MINYYHLERYAVVREGMCMLSSNSIDVERVGGGACSKKMYEQIPWLELDILLLDMNLDREQAAPLSLCLRICEEMRSRFPSIRIILHSPYSHAIWINRFLKAGIRGIVSKDSFYSEITKGMIRVMQNKIFICPLIATQFSNTAAFEKDNSIHLKPYYKGITPRETDVLSLIVQGLSSKSIAATLHLSTKTIETHRKNLVQKAHAKNSAELVRYAVHQGLVIA